MRYIILKKKSRKSYLQNITLIYIIRHIIFLKDIHDINCKYQKSKFLKKGWSDFIFL